MLLPLPLPEAVTFKEAIEFLRYYELQEPLYRALQDWNSVSE